MPTFLSDPGQGLYLVLIAVPVIAAVPLARNQDRKSLVRFLLCALPLALVFLIDRLFESTREAGERAVQAMVRAANERNADAFAAHLADTVEYTGEGTPVRVSRDGLRTSQFWSALRQFNVRAAAWDFARDDVREVGPDAVEIGFLAKGEADGKQFPVYLRATFTRQPDGRVLLTALSSYDPLRRQNARLSIPHFP